MGLGLGVTVADGVMDAGKEGKYDGVGVVERVLLTVGVTVGVIDLVGVLLMDAEPSAPPVGRSAAVTAHSQSKFGFIEDVSKRNPQQLIKSRVS